MDDSTKFAHLLQPIKDLASNWNINIADELGEYLDELESLTFAFEDGPSLNFAEAALLIQGSACVYSKKVEYLHSLVFRALDFINQKRQQQEAAKTKQRRTAAAADVAAHDNESFLDVDQLLEEGKDIDLDPNNTNKVIQAVKRPTMLLAFETFGARHGDGDSGLYMVQRCAMHSSGALLLEPADGDAYDSSLAPLTPQLAAARATSTAAQPFGQTPATGGVLAAAQPADMQTAQGAAVQPESAIAQTEGALEGVEGAGMEIEGDAPMIEGGFDDFDDDNGLPMDMGYDDTEPTDAGEAGPSGSAEQQVAERAAIVATAAGQEGAVEDEGLVDPYTMLDMHDPGTWKSRPYNRGVPRRPPQAPSGGPSWLAQLSLRPPAATNGPLAFPDLLPALKKVQALAKQQQRKGKRALEDELRRREGPASAWGAAVTLHAEDDEQQQDAPWQTQAMLGGANDPADYSDDDHGAPFDDWGNGALESTVYGAWDPLQGALDGPADEGEQTYEDLCRAHIDAFINAAAAAQVQTELASRVSSWQVRIQPLLEEQSQRPEFDIHHYGKMLMDKLADLSLDDNGRKACQGQHAALPPTEQVSLDDVFSVCEEPYDVSRMFSSMLQLINNGNLTIDSKDAVVEGALEGEPSGIRVQLLKLHMIHERFERDELVPATAQEAGASPARKRSRGKK